MSRPLGYNDAIARSKRNQKVDSEELLALLRPREKQLAPNAPSQSPTATSAPLPMSRVLTLPANAPLDSEQLGDVEQVLLSEQRLANKLAKAAADDGGQVLPAGTTTLHRCAIRDNLERRTKTAFRDARVLGPAPSTITTGRLLEEFFMISSEPNAAEYAFLSSRTGVNEQQIKTWFACRRAEAHSSFVARAVVGGDSEVARIFRMRQEQLATRPPARKKPLWMV